MSKDLRLSLKTKWFEMTKSGIKIEDYRELTPYWCRRLLNPYGLKNDYEGFDFSRFYEDLSLKNAEPVWMLKEYKFRFKHFDVNTMTLGYPKSTDTERIVQFEHAGIEIRTGNTEWGAVEGKLYFVIKHGKKINGY